MNPDVGKSIAQSSFRTSLALLTSALLAVAMQAAAEPHGSIEALDAVHGRFVRITLQQGHSPHQIEGRLRGRTKALIELAHGGHRISVPVEAVERVELLPRGRLRGMILGSLAWGALAFATADEEQDVSRVARAGAGMLAGAAIGALYDWKRSKPAEVLYER